MKNIFKKMSKLIWNKITEDSNEILEEKEYDEFASKIAKRIKNLHKHFGTIKAEDHLQLALLIENVRTQKKITESNESLKAATWILAISTIAFTVGSIYGVTELNNLLGNVLWFVVGLAVIGLTAFVLKGVWNIVKFVIRFYSNFVINP